MQTSRSFRHFARHLFLAGKVCFERNSAKEYLYEHIENIRKSIIKMNLRYSDIDRLKERIDNYINWEKKYAKFFKLEDKEKGELKNHVEMLEQELKNEREEKQRVISETNEKISQLTESVTNLKSQMKHIAMERARRHHRYKAIDQKIKERIDIHKYHYS